MQTYLLHLLIYSFAVYLVSRWTRLLVVKNFRTAFFFSIVVGIVNSVIRPIFVILSFPITLLTLGLFLLFINGLMLLISAAFFKEIKINGCISAAIASLLISIIVFVLEYFVHL